MSNGLIPLVSADRELPFFVTDRVPHLTMRQICSNLRLSNDLTFRAPKVPQPLQKVFSFFILNFEANKSQQIKWQIPTSLLQRVLCKI